MNTLIRFMEGGAGRAARIVMGLLLLVVGFAVIGGPVGAIVGVIGLVPLAMGITSPCLLGCVIGSGPSKSKGA